jgi:hypothetical protein
MSDTPEPILSEEEARRRFLVFNLIRLAGVAVLIGGMFLARERLSLGSGALILVGVLSLFLKPKWLGLSR